MTFDKKYEFWIDRGGTFTDVVAHCPDGAIKTHKLLSENPKHYQDATVQGIREILNLSAREKIPAEKISVIKMGTTVATNALLERKGEPTLLAITKGFRDALRIAYQARPRLFDRNIIQPEMLYDSVVEIEERIGANGEIICPINEPDTFNLLNNAYKSGIRSVAIVLMNSYRYVEHEKL